MKKKKKKKKKKKRGAVDNFDGIEKPNTEIPILKDLEKNRPVGCWKK